MRNDKLDAAKELIGFNKTSDAITLLESVFSNSSYQDELILIKSSFTEANNRESTLNFEDFQRYINGVNKQLLELINNVDPNELIANYSSLSNEIQILGLKRISNTLIEKVKKIYEGDVVIIGDRNAFIMYVDALNNVNNRFLTTSYIDSHFWVQEGDDLEIISANEKLIERIGNVNGDISNGYHRLFIVPKEINGYISNQVDSAVSKFKAGEKEELNKLNLIIKKLESISDKIQMKVVDIDSLPRPIRSNDQDFFNPKNFNMEIALYDNFRVDIFKLDNGKKINSTRAISKKYKNFDTISQRVCKYFNEAWNHENCVSVNYFLDVLKAELKYQTLSKIDYDAEWLIMYDFLIRSDNHILSSEKSSLLGYLGKTNMLYKNHLDIGVCTGRYPEELKEKKLISNSYSIDLDSDVAEWMAKFRKDVPFLRWDIRLPSVIEELNKTFRVKKFDLITCMVSTISHFNRIDTFKKFDLKTGLFKGLENMGELLNNNGRIVISTWSDFDILRNKEIDLYNTNSIDYLEKHTPTIDEIMEVLNTKNEKFVFEKQLDNDKFNIYIIRKEKE